MVTGNGQRVVQPAKNTAVEMADRRGLAVHHLAGAHHLGTECLPQRLVPQANAEDRQLAGKMLDGS
ncbi:hypothetical protein D3C72_2383840 [compost metagenome]